MFFRALSFLLFFNGLAYADGVALADKPTISIVVDDLGDNSIIARQMAELPVTLTMAILPKTPHAQKIANVAYASGHEVIMHLPMEALTRPDLLGPGAIYQSMEQAEVDSIVGANASSIPHLVGFNNHMGSLLTQDPQIMAWLMVLAKQHNWYFLDSKTSHSSVGEAVARDYGIATIGRDIFLDHQTPGSEETLKLTLERRWQQAKAIARETGQVVVICHPYPETLAFLQQQLLQTQEDFNFEKISELIRDKNIEFLVENESEDQTAGLSPVISSPQD